MKYLFLLMVTMFISLASVGQNYIYRGDDRFEATNTWRFPLNGHYWTGDPEITIGKRANGGLLMISIATPYKMNYIVGTLTVFLSDGTTIKCTDKNARDYVDSKSIAVYEFTATEIERLKVYRIMKIRFSIAGGIEGPDALTADNNTIISGPIDVRRHGVEISHGFETQLEIAALFGSQ